MVASCYLINAPRHDRRKLLRFTPRCRPRPPVRDGSSRSPAPHLPRAIRTDVDFCRSAVRSARRRLRHGRPGSPRMLERAQCRYMRARVCARLQHLIRTRFRAELHLVGWRVPRQRRWTGRARLSRRSRESRRPSRAEARRRKGQARGRCLQRTGRTTRFNRPFMVNAAGNASRRGAALLDPSVDSGRRDASALSAPSGRSR